MSTLSSASTLAQIQDSYDDNASYEEDGSLSKAKAFSTAVRMLLRRIPEESRQGGDSIRFRPEVLRKELDEVQEWIARNARSSRVTRYDHSRFRC